MSQKYNYTCEYCKAHFEAKGQEFKGSPHAENAECYWKPKNPEEVTEKWDCEYCIVHYGDKYTITRHKKNTECSYKPREPVVWECEYCKFHFGNNYDGTHHSSTTPCKFNFTLFPQQQNYNRGRGNNYVRGRGYSRGRGNFQ